MQFICGSIVVTLLILSFFDPQILEDDIIFDRNGIWWLAVCGSILAFAHAFIPEDTFVFHPEEDFARVSEHTHYLPARWKDCRSPSVIKEFSSFFEYRLVGIAKELLGVILVPFVFLFSLSRNVDEIIQFIGENTVHVDGVGEVCSFSDFDFEKHGNMNFGSIHSVNKSCQSRQGKMEKSFMAFVNHYPDYEPTREQQAVVGNLSSFWADTDNSVTSSGPTEHSEVNQSILQLDLPTISKVQQNYRDKRNQKDVL